MYQKFINFSQNYSKISFFYKKWREFHMTIVNIGGQEYLKSYGDQNTLWHRVIVVKIVLFPDQNLPFPINQIQPYSNDLWYVKKFMKKKLHRSLDLLRSSVSSFISLNKF